MVSENIGGTLASSASRSAEKGGCATVVIVDDDRVLSDLLADRLKTEEPGLHCAGVADNPDDARALVAERQPDVILLDGVDFHNWWPVGDSRKIDPIEFAAELIEMSRSSYLFIWTHWSDPSPNQQDEINLRLRAARAGAEALVLKGEGLDHLLEVIRSTLDRGSPPRNHVETQMFAGIENLIAEIEPAAGEIDDELSPTERERAPKIARGLEAGMKIGEIAASLHLSVAGLRSTIRSIYRKWEVGNQTQFVAEAHRRGYLQ